LDKVFGTHSKAGIWDQDWGGSSTPFSSGAKHAIRTPMSQPADILEVCKKIA
jgi:hypothetical protein